ncbi:MATE family efflux transporter [Peptacetobacter sp.]|uniref:MATE family efflux transporter n=1 Tax=Peptacetobacter sp. TaxID=2991975 RepID=UPI002630D85E|nr:MATE family efflux transporter [Peptacetobacter sp.]
MELNKKENLCDEETCKLSKNTMTEGSIFKTILIFSIPLILGNLLQQMYNTVDSIIVGNYVGSNALAAVGSSSSIIYLLIAFSQGISVGSGVIVSQAIGSKNKRDIQLSVHTSISISIVLGAILSILGFIFTPQLLKLMHTPNEVMVESVKYLRLYSIGLIFNVIYNMEAGILNSVGNSKRSLLYLGIASGINILFDLLFIKTLKLGVSGAAIATNISQAIACLITLLYLIRVSEDYKVIISKIKIHKDMAIKLIKIGLPRGIQNMVVSLSNVLIQSSVNIFGPVAMAGFGAYLKVDGFNILPVLSFSMASTTFTGQNYGAGKMDRVKKGMWITLIMSIVYTVVIGAVLLKNPSDVIHMFSQDTEVIKAGVVAMKYFCPFYVLLAILHSLAGTVRGVGKSIPPMIVLLVSLCLFRVICILYVIPMTRIDNVYILYPISWLIGAILMIGYIIKAKPLSIK